MTLQNITSNDYVTQRYQMTVVTATFQNCEKLDGLFGKFMTRKVAVAVALSSCEEAEGLTVDAGKSLVDVVFDFLLGVAVKVIPDLATLHRTRRWYDRDDIPLLLEGKK